eukprot:gene17792-36423_t
MNLRIDTGKCEQSGMPHSPILDFFNASLSDKDYPSAKIKIDELFFEWLTHDVTRRLIDVILDQATGSTQSPDSIDAGKLASLSIQAIQHNQDKSNSSQPPRSPTKKSPKKRTQSEMQNNQNLVRSNINLPVDNTLISENEVDYATASARRPRSNFDSIPIFFQSGQNIKNNNR